MDEKIIVKSERVSLKGYVIVIIACLLMITYLTVDWMNKDKIAHELGQAEFDLRYTNVDFGTYDEEKHKAAEEAYREASDIRDSAESKLGINFLFCFAIIFSIVSILSLKDTELVISDKRVYGKTSFGKRVDLPLDSISAVGIIGKKNIAISTASGKIAFKGIKNRDAIHKELNNLLIERQNKTKSDTPVVKQEPATSNADELKKYRELLDSGIITQEEFDAKKKQLLGF